MSHELRTPLAAILGYAELMHRGHGPGVTSAAFSPDGARIVTGSFDRTVRVWDTESGAQLMALRGHDGTVWSVAFSPDGLRIITGADDNTARVWDSRWLRKMRGADLALHVCVEKLIGYSKHFTNEDALEPLLSSLAGTNPCKRVGPLSVEYWRQIVNRVVGPSNEVSSNIN